MSLMLPIIAVAVLIALTIESLYGDGGHKSVGLNLATGTFQLLFSSLAAPVFGSVVVYVFGSLKYGHIHLSGKGWMLPVSVLVFLACMDLADYSFHRLQHRVPWLWAMHSYHHSDRTYNATTGYRHYWLDRPLVSLAYVPIGLVFNADKSVLVVATLVGWMLPIYAHMNLRIGLGKFSWLFVSPQFHRLHHSTEKEHYDRNFSGFLPIWDVLFGTYREPKDYPETGIEDGEPEGILAALAWPVRSSIGKG